MKYNNVCLYIEKYRVFKQLISHSIWEREFEFTFEKVRDKIKEKDTFNFLNAIRLRQLIMSKVIS